VLLTGRCEAFLRGQKDLKLVIDRLTAYAEAGADCLYAPGIATAEEISAVVKAVAPRPVNLLVGAAGPSLKIAGDLGVRRISVGGALARMAWTGFMKHQRRWRSRGRSPNSPTAIPAANSTRCSARALVPASALA